MTGAILGIDLGSRRVGLAISDGGGIAAPLATVPRGPDVAADARAIGVYVTARAVASVVVGLPLERDGSEGPMAIEARSWGVAIAAALGLPVAFRDERLSSHVAEERIGPMGRGRTGGPPSRKRRDAYRARVDREAAAVILQDELDARAAARIERHEEGA